ncbi:matrixin family metalloprotease [Streptomyces sp. NPDC059247]|uniref:matrixin family metalloprotease n=1 Tax=Streptomyces sp. NPDC059247 TaxID=3346790 RepID=UPI0036AA7BC4
MRTNALALTAASAAAVLLALPAPVRAASLPARAATPATCKDGRSDARGRSSVDGTEIAWDDETRFDDALRTAHRLWSAGSLTRVKIRPDDATTWADLVWRDADSTSGEWKDVYGRWAGRSGTDTIELNAAYLGEGRPLGRTEHRRRVAAHEMGHALGFCHKPLSYRSLMWSDYDDLAADRIDAPTSRDIGNYHALWGRSR